MSKISAKFDELRNEQMIQFALEDPTMKPLVEPNIEMWRRRNIDGNFLSFLNESQGLIKYSLDMSDQAQITTVTAWINKYCGQQVQALDCVDVPWTKPKTQQEITEHRAKDFEASARRIKMDVENCEQRLAGLKASEGENSAAYKKCLDDKYHLQGRIVDAYEKAAKERGQTYVNNDYPQAKPIPTREEEQEMIEEEYEPHDITIPPEAEGISNVLDAITNGAEESKCPQNAGESGYMPLLNIRLRKSQHHALKTSNSEDGKDQKEVTITKIDLQDKDEKEQKLLAEEIRIMTCLDQSPALMHMLDGWFNTRHITLVNNYYYGPTLKYMLNQGEKGGVWKPKLLRMSRVKKAGKQLLEAVAHIHKKGVAHRNITSGNIIHQLGSGKMKLAGLSCKVVADKDNLKEQCIVPCLGEAQPYQTVAKKTKYKGGLSTTNSDIELDKAEKDPAYECTITKGKTQYGKKHDCRCLGLVMLHMFSRNDKIETWQRDEIQKAVEGDDVVEKEIREATYVEREVGEEIAEEEGQPQDDFDRKYRRVEPEEPDYSADISSEIDKISHAEVKKFLKAFFAEGATAAQLLKDNWLNKNDDDKKTVHDYWDGDKAPDGNPMASLEDLEEESDEEGSSAEDNSDPIAWARGAGQYQEKVETQSGAVPSSGSEGVINTMIGLCKKLKGEKRKQEVPDPGDKRTRNIGLLIMKFESTAKAQMINSGDAKKEEISVQERRKDPPVLRTLYGTATLYYRISHKRFAILTAAHNFVQTEINIHGEEESNIASDAWFYLGCNGPDEYKFKFKVEKFEVYPTYYADKTVQIGHDIALAVVKIDHKDKMYNAKAFKMIEIPVPDFCGHELDVNDKVGKDPPPLVGQDVFICGYPVEIYDPNKDKDHLSGNDHYLYSDTGKVSEVHYHKDGNISAMIYKFEDLATSKGQSGAPIQYKNPQTDNYTIIGVHDGNHDVNNFGTFIVMAIYLDFIVPTLLEFSKKFGSQEKNVSNEYTHYLKQKIEDEYESQEHDRKIVRALQEEKRLNAKVKKAQLDFDDLCKRNRGTLVKDRQKANQARTDLLERAKVDEDSEYNNIVKLFSSLPDFMEFDDQSMFMWNFTKDNYTKHAGLFDVAKLMDDTVLNMEVEDDGQGGYQFKRFDLYQNDLTESGIYINNDGGEDVVTSSCIYFRTGQIDDGPDGGMIVHGLGRKMRLWPEYKDEERTEVDGYVGQLCYILEGQFVNDKLLGFGRCIYGINNTSHMGWFSDKEKLHGYGVEVSTHLKREDGVWLNGKNITNDISDRDFNMLQDFEPQYLKWNDFMVPMEKAQQLPIFTIKDKKTGKTFTKGGAGAMTMRTTLQHKKAPGDTKRAPKKGGQPQHIRDDDKDVERQDKELGDRYTRVEKTVDNTVVYLDNITGDTVFRQTIKGKTYFQRDDGKDPQATFKHYNKDGTTINRRRNARGQVYFEDENGVPMVREVEPDTGRTRFVEAEDGPVTYEYRAGAYDHKKGTTMKGSNATIMSRTMKMEGGMYKKKERARQEKQKQEILATIQEEEEREEREDPGAKERRRKEFAAKPFEYTATIMAPKRPVYGGLRDKVIEEQQPEPHEYLPPYLRYPNKTMDSERDMTPNCPIWWGSVGMQGWRSGMEDAHINDTIKLVGEKSFRLPNGVDDWPTGYIHAVMDGHGGARVAKFVGEHFVETLKNTEEFQAADYQAALTKTFIEVDNSVSRMWWSKHTGCTACVVLITPTKIICANAGDSRACMKMKDKVVPLSHDHKPTDPRERARIETYGMSVCDDRVDGVLAVARALGDFAFKQKPILKPEGQAVTCIPDFIELDRTPEDQYIVIACDGIWDCKSNDETVAYLDKEIYDQKGLKKWRDLTDPIEKMLDSIVADDRRRKEGQDIQAKALENYEAYHEMKKDSASLYQVSVPSKACPVCTGTAETYAPVKPSKEEEERLEKIKQRLQANPCTTRMARGLAQGIEGWAERSAVLTTDNCSCIAVYFHESMGYKESGEKPQSPQRAREITATDVLQRMNSAERKAEDEAREAAKKDREERQKAKDKDKEDKRNAIRKVHRAEDKELGVASSSSEDEEAAEDKPDIRKDDAKGKEDNAISLDEPGQEQMPGGYKKGNN